ncbi:transposase family protein [Allosalinactinospora lopnorensis]|uniref:transposase family protein n=1 Tax=Allosalinactinospora lopnorensis TaxID=1352348 RepID=UPI0022A96D49|nr:transposase family protein [Allosalinactinospora lopnorensis]
MILADAGYETAGSGILTTIKRLQEVAPERLHHDTQAYNLLLRGLRSIGERAMAALTGQWRLLRHTTKSPSRIGAIVKAALTLTLLDKETR